MNSFPSLHSHRENTDFNIWSLLRDIHRDCKSVDTGLSLTANENVMSRLSSSMLSTALESRYHLGDDCGSTTLASKGGLLYRRLTGVMALESAAREAALKMLSASHIDFRPLSGVHAMNTTLLSVTEPGDAIYSFSPAAGGHFATANILKRAARYSRYLPWDPANFDIDFSRLAEDIKENGRPKLVFLDHGATLFPLNIRKLRALVGAHALIAYDVSHTLGLIFGGEFQSPLRDGCDILQGNTHKSFPGPQKAMIAFRDQEIGAKVSKAMDDGLVSSQHTHHSAALYLAILEMEQYGRAYAQQMIKNAKALANELGAQGFSLISRKGESTNSHVVLINACGELPVRSACEQLMRAGISTNSRPFQGQDILRFGVQELTRRGMKEAEMTKIACLMARLLLKDEDAPSIKKEVFELRQRFNKVHFSFDDDLSNSSIILMN